MRIHFFWRPLYIHISANISVCNHTKVGQLSSRTFHHISAWLKVHEFNCPTFVCMYACMYVCMNVQFLLMSPTPVHYHVDHASLLLCLSVNSFSNSEKLDSYHSPPIYLIVKFQYTHIAVS